MTTPLPSLDSLRVSLEDHVATVVLRATGKANRMGPAFWAEMPRGVRVARCRRPRCARSSCAAKASTSRTGWTWRPWAGELGSVVGDGALARERTEFLATIERLQRAVTCVAACRKPVIAAIAGWCIGGGVDLATACDVRLCAADARFSVREVKLAMVADVGTLARLPAIVGQGHARLLALTGDDIDAARALRIGLVEDVYDTHAALFDAAGALAPAHRGQPTARRPGREAGAQRGIRARSRREPSHRGAVERGVPSVARPARSDVRVRREARAAVRGAMRLATPRARLRRSR